MHMQLAQIKRTYSHYFIRERKENVSGKVNSEPPSYPTATNYLLCLNMVQAVPHGAQDASYSHTIEDEAHQKYGNTEILFKQHGYTLYWRVILQIVASNISSRIILQPCEGTIDSWTALACGQHKSPVYLFGKSAFQNSPSAFICLFLYHLKCIRNLSATLWTLWCVASLFWPNVCNALASHMDGWWRVSVMFVRRQLLLVL